MIPKISKLFGRFSITKKIAVSSFIVILLAASSGVYSFITLRSCRTIDNQLANGFYPLISSMKDYEDLIANTSSLSTNWMYLPNPEDKSSLNKIIEEEYPHVKEEILSTLTILSLQNKSRIEEMFSHYDIIVTSIKKLKESLGTEEAYIDDFLLFELIPLLDDEISSPSKDLQEEVSVLTSELRDQSESVIQQKFNSFDNVEMVIIIMTMLAVIIGIITTLLTTRTIVGPVKKANDLITSMSKGALPNIEVKETKDEIGDMIASIKILREGLSNTAQFATRIKQGDLATDYQLLSNEDILGQSLVAMRDNLKQVIDDTNVVVRSVAEEGDLSQRMSIKGKEGAWKEVTESVNNLFSSIAQPIQPMKTVLEAMAAGDLSARVNEELKGDFKSLTDSLNFALENLNSFLGNIRKNAGSIEESTTEMLSTSEEMNNTTGEIASAIGEMSSGAQSQVHKVDESSSLVETILQSSNNMGSQAEEINEAAKKGEKSSNTGLSMVNKVNFSIKDIKAFANETNDSIGVLTQRSNEITQVLSIITDIASQTNLLALNAAIEAAQAGDAGRGFAVVAEEIRKLAEDSRKSAREIEKLVADVQKDTQSAAKTIAVMNESIKGGEEASNDASSAFNEIASSSSQTLRLSEEILNASKRQTESIKNVVNITENIVVIAEQTSAGTEEVASSATELSSGMNTYSQRTQEVAKIAIELKSGIAKFKLS